MFKHFKISVSLFHNISFSALYDVMCDFEDMKCPMEYSEGLEDNWKRVQAKGTFCGKDNTLHLGIVRDLAEAEEHS